MIVAYNFTFTDTNPITHPPGQVWRRHDRANLENESCLSVKVDPKNVLNHVPTSKNRQIKTKKLFTFVVPVLTVSD